MTGLRITIVQGPFQPVPAVMGGAVEKLWFDLGREFSRRGFKVNHVSRRFEGMPDSEEIDGVRHLRVPSFDVPRSRLVSKLLDFVYSIRCMLALPPSDVVVTNTFFMPLLLTLMPRRGRVVYVSVHRFPQGQMRLYGKVDRLQCVSSAVAEAVREQAPAVGHLIKVVPNYVAAWRSSDDVQATWDLRQREVLFVGRIHPEKGIDLLLRAYAAVPAPVRDGWKLVFVGPHVRTHGGGGEQFLEEMRQLAERLGVSVDWVGPIYDRALLDQRYAGARVFVYPSTAAKGEALPLAPLEAMAQGCPVVTSDLLCFKDYLEPGVNGGDFELGTDDPARRLSASITSLMADDLRQRRYSLAGLRTVERFTLPLTAQTLLDDFAQLHAGQLGS